MSHKLLVAGWAGLIIACLACQTSGQDSLEKSSQAKDTASSATAWLDRLEFVDSRDGQDASFNHCEKCEGAECPALASGSCIACPAAKANAPCCAQTSSGSCCAETSPGSCCAQASSGSCCAQPASTACGEDDTLCPAGAACATAEKCKATCQHCQKTAPAAFTFHLGTERVFVRPGHSAHPEATCAACPACPTGKTCAACPGQQGDQPVTIGVCFDEEKRLFKNISAQRGAECGDCESGCCLENSTATTEKCGGTCETGNCPAVAHTAAIRLSDRPDSAPCCAQATALPAIQISTRTDVCSETCPHCPTGSEVAVIRSMECCAGNCESCCQGAKGCHESGCCGSDCCESTATPSCPCPAEKGTGPDAAAGSISHPMTSTPASGPCTAACCVSDEAAQPASGMAWMLHQSLRGCRTEQEGLATIQRALEMVADQARAECREQMVQQQLAFERETAQLRGSLLQMQGQLATTESLKQWLGPLYTNQNRNFQQLQLLANGSADLQRTLAILEKSMDKPSREVATPLGESAANHVELRSLKLQLQRLEARLERMTAAPPVRNAGHLQPLPVIQSGHQSPLPSGPSRYDSK